MRRASLAEDAVDSIDLCPNGLDQQIVDAFAVDPHTRGRLRK